MNEPSQRPQHARSGTDRRDSGQVGGDHYARMQITPWEFLESCLTPEEFRGYLKGEAIVYIARELSKAGPVDIGKARHVLQKLEDVYPVPKPADPVVTELDAIRFEASLGGLSAQDVIDAAAKVRAMLPTLESVAASLAALRR